MTGGVAQDGIHYVEHGAGTPMLVLHGAGVDHRETEAALEPLLAGAACRRVYLDLPGMGRSPAGELTANAEVVTLLGRFIDRLGGGPVLLVGHSYGAYLARGVAGRRRDVLGLALLCPIGARTGDVPAHAAVRQDEDAHAELDPALRDGFDEYFVVRTAATARRYREHVAPARADVDEAGLGRIFGSWPVDVGTTYSGATLIVAGRQDSTAGYREAIGLADAYPRSTLAVVDGAGHALMHERPRLLAGLLGDWLDRAGAA